MCVNFRGFLREISQGICLVLQRKAILSKSP